MGRPKKTFLSIIAGMFALLCLYLASYGVYDYTGLVSSPAMRLKLLPLYEPCRSVVTEWNNRRDRKLAELEFLGDWGSDFRVENQKISINDHGDFTMQYGAQSIRGKGKFEMIDEVLHFVVITNCHMDRETQSYPQLVSDYNNLTPVNESLRIEIHLYASDNPERYELCA
jgi:hypothetical protein